MKHLILQLVGISLTIALTLCLLFLSAIAVGWGWSLGRSKVHSNPPHDNCACDACVGQAERP